MNTRRSALSMSIKQEPSFNQSRLVDHSETFNEIFTQIKAIKKQLKQRVTRSQFMSSLSSKLSISELASFSLPQHKQNTNPNHHQINNHEQLRSFSQQIQQLFNQVNSLRSQICLQDFEKVKQSWLQVQKKLIYHQRKIDRLEEQNNEREENQKKRLAEVEAYIYRKAERSQIQKLFTLNELLVIEIEQAKHKVEQCSKIFNIQLKQIREALSSQIAKVQKAQSYSNTHSKDFQHRVSQQQKIISKQIDKIFEILQAKQNRKQQNQQLFSVSLEELHHRLVRIQNEENLSLKQLTTRVNVLQIKENQINRSVRQVDSMKSQMEAFKIDVLNLHERSSEVNVNVKQFCESTVKQTQRQLSQRFTQQIQLACQQIMKKLFQLTSQMPNNDELTSILSPIKQKQRHLILSQSQNSRKIDFLQKKQQQIQQQIQQEIQHNQQRYNSIRNQLKNYVSYGHSEEMMKRYVKVDELKELAKCIDAKMEMQVRGIVEEQDKINQVICAENIMAKWFWNSAALKGGNLVSWDKQVVNTLPENFKWNKNQPVVSIRKGGYYRIEMGFYSKKKPTVQLIVNGQTIVSAVNTSSYVLHHSSGKLKDVSNSQIAGLTYVDYLLLPDDARIAISYIGDFTGEGFISIHRV